ncbi:MAG: U32 family peptidase [Clostridia bacterium]|nr:U32 family peptidase [Clostridia bacterium]
MIDLLSPVGDFECLKAAVQNGSDSVYFGANLFSARAFASNFDISNLQDAIQYAKVRGVKTNLTLNTLIKDDEFNDALLLVKKAYEFGIDAVIVQDLGLAMRLKKSFPDLPIHGSTQMTIHNLNGALELQKLGFKRVVLSRELSTEEIEYICKNTDIEIECFVHGALCVSYSGQCLFSSMIGGRSGNRGKCAQPCRLPYELLENDKKIDSGYLLSTRDLCGLDYIPFFIKAGVHCLKIEGRMKSPEYVATVTRIYRKYIDLALSDKPYEVDDKDRKELMQVFNRGMSSSGHLEKEPNNSLVFKDKPNNMGLFLGIVQDYNKNKGYITLKLNETIEIGDTISLQNETGSYTISELMENGKNITSTKIGQIVTVGRMKGNIKSGDKIYKMSSKLLTTNAKESYKQENRKIDLNCKVTVKKDKPVSIKVTSANDLETYKNLNISYELDCIPLEAKNRPLDRDSIIKQISKTSSTPFNFKNISIDLDDNAFLPKLSTLNQLRRNILEEVEDFALSNICRNPNIDLNKESENIVLSNMRSNVKNNIKLSENHTSKISVLLNNLDISFNYNKLENIDNIYIPLKFFTSNKYENVLKTISKKFDTYIYMPTVIRVNYNNLFFAKAKAAVSKYNIKGFVISNIGNIHLLNNLFEDLDKHFKIISNYTLNVYNSNTVLELKKLGVSKFTISPELDKKSIIDLCDYNYLQKELIVYGKTPVLNMNYCLLGGTNKCYPSCNTKCTSDNSYYLKDRLNMKFRVIPDNIQTVTTIYNSKITSISPKDFNIDFARIDILDEDIEEINNIIKVVKSGNRLEGKEYTNGNLNRKI